jgi:hypothetical protein
VKNETKRGRGSRGKGGKRKKKSRRDWEGRPDNRLLVFGAGALLPRNFLG